MSNSLNINERSEVLELIDSYQNLLTPNQKNMVLAYFEFDLSLSEIAENEGISRAAVSDCINKSVQKLRDLESSLHHVKLKRMIEKCENEISQNCTETQKLALYKKLVEEIKDGI